MSYETLKGKTVDIKIWTPIAGVESQALDQLKNIAALPWVVHHVAVMPDVHFGKGATVGSVIAMKGAVSPAAVGVDIGCVDMDTEYLSPYGWKKIPEYNGGLVMDYDITTGRGSFVTPKAWMKFPCDKFLRLKTKYGVDQKLSTDHKVIYAKYDRAYKFDKLDTILAGDLAAIHERTTMGFRGRFITTFEPVLDTRLSCSNEDLRVIIMVAADGHFLSRNPDDSHKKCRLRFKKQRKIERAIDLLTIARIPFDIRDPDTWGVTEIDFEAPKRLKSLGNLWEASLDQLRIIIGEVFHWDGNFEESCFYTRDKDSADFMSYAFTACGYRAVMRQDEHYRDGKIDYRVFAQNNLMVGIAGAPKSDIEVEPSIDGYKYCFRLDSGFWVMRRNGVIAMTGNCGMGAIRTSLTASHLPDNLSALRSEIERLIPVGFASHEHAIGRGSMPEVLKREADELWDSFNMLDEGVSDLEKRAHDQSGTLGGGNHFIELSLDDGTCDCMVGIGVPAMDCPECKETGKREPCVYMVLHSGSRNIGKTLAEIHMKKAMTLTHNQMLPDRDLAVFLSGTPEMDAYRRDLFWAQRYAFLNRKVMFMLYKQALLKFLPETMFGEPILCHHNYVAEEVHFGDEVIVTRKGAIRAGLGEYGIIPGSMGTKSYIVRGRGNPDSFMSASHGAGRRMSRGAAKRQYTKADVEEQTKGVECRKDDGVIDEIPAAYKNIDDVMKNQADLVDTMAILKQVLCVKG
jgi:tRNA-splicing ligase RtcB (3'-phosphate/5'-hydroxy nucleic acid ligase)